MKVLILGGNGQLGQCIKSLTGTTTDEYIFCGREEIDITDKNSIYDGIKTYNPNVIINCAAYTNVEKAEEDVENAMAINFTAVKNICDVCRENDVYLIHISTDFVFEGNKNTPYKETDETNPLNVYGRSKVRGENEVLKYDKGIVIRTSWLYSEYGKNFYKTMLQRIKEGKETNVVSDQIGTPTYAMDLAWIIVHVIIRDEKFRYYNGLYHFSNEGCCSWYDFAKAIELFYCINANKGYPSSLIKPCTTQEYPTKANRPIYSVMDKHKIYGTFKLSSEAHWMESLFICMQNKKNMTDKEFWDVVDSIGWKELTKGDDYIEKSKEKAKSLYKDKDKKWADEVFNKIREQEKKVDKLLKPIWLSNAWNEKGKFISDDSYWDLKAHIVGCGKDAVEKAISDPKSVFDDYIKNDDYKENFEYWIHDWYKK